MPKIDFAKKYDNFKTYRFKHDRQGLRYKKLISKVIREILKNNNQSISNKSLKKICIEVYGKCDKIAMTRTRCLLKDEAVRNNISYELQRTLTEKEIKPFSKSFELLSKAEKLAKNTSDFIKLVHFYINLPETESNQNNNVQNTDIDYSTLRG